MVLTKSCIVLIPNCIPISKEENMFFTSSSRREDVRGDSNILTTAAAVVVALPFSSLREER